MQVLCSPYNEDVQFADCLNVHLHRPPPKKKDKKEGIFMPFL